MRGMLEQVERQLERGDGMMRRGGRLELYEAALKESYDVIISDVMLPGMDGFTLVKKLRDMKVRTPVIMLTARVELQDKLRSSYLVMSK